MEQISRAKQIYYELKGVARVQDHRERLEMLKEYESELLEIGGLRGSTIKGVLGLTVRALIGVPEEDVLNMTVRDLIGDTPEEDVLNMTVRDLTRDLIGYTTEEGVLKMTVEDLLNQTIDIPRENWSDYVLALNEWKRLTTESSRKVKRLDKFKGAADDFKNWFTAQDDNQVEAIFGKTYTPITPIEWKGSPADACRFALAVWGPGSNDRLNGVFQRTDKKGARFEITQQLKFRMQCPDRKNPVPEILKVIPKYQRIENEVFLRDYPSLRLYQSTGCWDTSKGTWVTKEEYENEESIQLPPYCR